MQFVWPLLAACRAFERTKTRQVTLVLGAFRGRLCLVRSPRPTVNCTRFCSCCFSYIRTTTFPPRLPTAFSTAVVPDSHVCFVSLQVVGRYNCTSTRPRISSAGGTLTSASALICLSYCYVVEQYFEDRGVEAVAFIPRQRVDSVSPQDGETFLLCSGASSAVCACLVHTSYVCAYTHIVFGSTCVQSSAQSPQRNTADKSRDRPWFEFVAPAETSTQPHQKSETTGPASFFKLCPVRAAAQLPPLPPPVFSCDRCVPCVPGGKGYRGDLPGSKGGKR